MKVDIRKQSSNNIENRVKAVNVLHKHINYVTPKIINLLKDNLSLKVDNSLTKRSHNLISKYLGYNDNTKISCYLDTSYNSFSLLTFKISYKNKKTDPNFDNWGSVKEDFYLWDNSRKWCDIKKDFIITRTELNEFVPRKTKTLKSVLSVICKSNKLKDKIELINSQIQDTEKQYRNFLNK